MINSVSKIVTVFGKTFYYYLISHARNADILHLKQQWALSVLKVFKLELQIINSHTDEQKMIFVGNHISFLDIIVLMAAEPKIVFLSKAEVAKWPIIGPAAKRVGTIFVKRDSASSRSQSKSEISTKIKNSTESIYIAGFPSGTTQLSENLPWKKGLFDIAQSASIPMQSFKLQYSPLRECAYIDDDNLLLTMHRLLKTKNKKVTLAWGDKHHISDILRQTDEIRHWTINTHN